MFCHDFKGENYTHLFNSRPNICKSCCLNTHFILNNWFDRILKQMKNDDCSARRLRATFIMNCIPSLCPVVPERKFSVSGASYARCAAKSWRIFSWIWWTRDTPSCTRTVCLTTMTWRRPAPRRDRELVSWPAELSFNFHLLEVVSRYRDPQLQVGENYSHFFV